ncbi:MAG: hypothetical protein ACRCW4_14145 [Candidatus Neomicrothrix subdominans]
MLDLVQRLRTVADQLAGLSLGQQLTVRDINAIVQLQYDAATAIEQLTTLKAES